jgi:hypothetical protein
VGVPTIRVERGGKKASRLTKFKVHLDGAPVGTLRRWGDHMEFEVTPGSHSLEVTSFGGMRGSTDIDIEAGETLDLMCGIRSVVGTQLKWMAGGDALAIWEADGPSSDGR